MYRGAWGDYIFGSKHEEDVCYLLVGDDEWRNVKTINYKFSCAFSKKALTLQAKNAILYLVFALG